MCDSDDVPRPARALTHEQLEHRGAGVYLTGSEVFPHGSTERRDLVISAATRARVTGITS
jgi:hypothetical protein